MRYLVEYRKGDVGEIECVVDASDEEDAVKKFLAGKVESFTVNFFVSGEDQVNVFQLGSEDEV